MSAFDLHCSLGADRSVTDPVSNWTNIGGTRFDEDFVSMCLTGRYPRRLMGPFLHEITHHWCFHSPVGHALALLSLRARRRANKRLDVCEELDLAEDYTRYTIATRMLRPLAEGMACFAEFDMLPSHAHSISAPSLWAFFAFSELGSETPSYLDFTKALASYRISKECIERKANLLASPLSCREGGYLPGYLLVKYIYHELIFRKKNKCVALSDSDLYLTYLRNFIYGDLGLVAKLLDPHACEMQAARNISEHIQLRVKEIVEKSTEETVAYSNSPRSKAFGIDSSLITDPILAKVGMDRLQELQEEIEVGCSLHEKWAINNRNVMCVGAFDVKIRIDNNGLIKVGESECDLGVLNIMGENGLCSLQGNGTIQIFLVPQNGVRFFSIWLGDELVALRGLGNSNNADIESAYKEFNSEANAAWKEAKRSRGVLDHAIKQVVTCDLVDHIVSEIIKITEGFYDRTTLVHTPEEALLKARDAMRDFGFCGVLPNVDDVRLLAKLSCAASVTCNEREIAELLKLDASNLASVRSRLEMARFDFNVPVMHVSGGIVLCYA